MPNLCPLPRAGRLGRVAALAAAGLLGSCASYPARTEAALRDFSSGHLSAALERYADPDLTDSPFLAGVEEGTVALAAGQWERARDAFARAADVVREVEERALTAPETLTAAAGSWLFNDRSLPYDGEGFERVMLHACLGLAYLALGRVDDVGVEVRLANRLLESEEDLYSTEYRAGGLGHLLSAVLYELRGELDDAYIDYRRMVDKGVGLDLAGPALVRLARALGRDDEHARWAERFGEDYERPDGGAAVVLVAGIGLGPYKTEGKLTLPLRDGIFSMAVPDLRARPQPVSGVRLVDDDSGTAVRSVVVEDVTEVSRENLKDRLAWIATKSIARGIAKRELTQSLEQEHGLAGRIAGDLFTFLSERADLRSWLTLPDTWQACRLFVPSGVRRFRVEAAGAGSVALGPLALEPGETLFVLVRTVGTHLYAHAIGGGAVPTPREEDGLPPGPLQALEPTP